MVLFCRCCFWFVVVVAVVVAEVICFVLVSGLVAVVAVVVAVNICCWLFVVLLVVFLGCLHCILLDFVCFMESKFTLEFHFLHN